MNYSRIYDQIIYRAQLREREPGVYYESHHITPKCLDGTNDKWNLVYLTGREHFLVHWLLVRMFSGNKPLASAFWAMCIIKGNKKQNHYTPSSRIIAEAKENRNTNEFREVCRQRNLGKKHTEEAKKKVGNFNLGRKQSIETIEKRRKSNTGKKRSEEFKAKIKKIVTGITRSIEAIEKTTLKNTGKKRTPEFCEQMRQLNLGRKVSSETRAKISRSKKLLGKN